MKDFLPETGKMKGFLFLAFFLCFNAYLGFSQTLTSDKDDYAPGTTATFTGSGFLPNEQVKLQVLHADETPDTGDEHDVWFVDADENGGFITTWHVCEDDCLGSTLRAYADGMDPALPARHAWVEFTDSGSFSYVTTSGKASSINIASGATNSTGLSTDIEAPKNNGSFNATLSDFTTTSGTTIGIGPGTNQINISSVQRSFVTTSNASDTKTFPVTVSIGSAVPSGTYNFKAAIPATSGVNSGGGWAFDVVVLAACIQPQGSLTANGPFCESGTGQLTWKATAGTGPYTVVYNDGVANRTQSSVTSGTPFNVFSNPVGANTTYTLVSVTGNSCTRTTGFTGGSASITVNPNPVVTGTLSVCVRSTTPLSGSGTPAGSNPWTSGTSSVATVNSTGLVTGVSAGSSVITYTNSNGCKKEVIVTVNPRPVPTFTTAPGSTSCLNTNITYTTQSGNPNYIWTFPGSLGADYSIVSGGTSTDNSVTLKYITPGSKTVTVNYTNLNGCTGVSPASNTTNVNAVVTATFNAAPATACIGKTVTYTTQSGKSNYLWTYPGSIASDYSISSGGGTSDNSVTLTWNTSGIRNVNVLYTDNTCPSDIASASTTVYPAINDNSIDAAQSICPNSIPAGLTGFTPTGGSGIYTYLWESSTSGAGSGFEPANGTNNAKDYSPGTLSQDTWYRRNVNSGGCAESTSNTVKITVEDVSAPVLTAEADQAVDLDANCAVTIPDLVDGSTATDNCTSTITQNPAAGTVVSSSHNGTVAVTVTAEDAAGNKDETVVTLTAKDVSAPVLTAEADQAVDLDANCAVTIPDLVDGSTATDNCTYTITQNPAAGTVVSSSHNGTVAVTVTAEDAAGNKDETVVTLTAKDVSAPVLTAEADQDVDLDANCAVTIPDLVDGSTATDNCTSTITQNPAAGTVVSSSHNGTVAVTVTAEDTAGNKDETVVTLTAKDVSAPVLTAEADQDVDLDANCAVTIPDLVDGSTATDNCTYTITQNPAAGTVVSSSHNGTVAVTVTAEDAAGNKDETVVTLTAKDVSAPVLTAEADQDVDLDANCAVTIPDLVDGSTATDNCTSTITQNPAAGTVVSSSHNGTIAVTVTAEDAAGNKDETVVTLTAKDVSAPVLTAEADQNVDLDANCAVTIPDLVDGSTATDNCTSTITQNPAAGTVVSSSHNGTVAVTVTAEDAAGNKDETVVTLTAKDVSAPKITCISDQTRPNDLNTCTYTVIGDEFAPLFFNDNCLSLTISNDFNNSNTLAGAVFPEGTTTVTWTVTDLAGNTSNCQFIVEVNNLSPEITSITGPIDPVQVDTGGVTLYADYDDNNLTSATWTLIANNGVVDQYTCTSCIGTNTVEGNFNPQPGVYTVELQITDACGEVDILEYEYIVIFDPSGGFVTGGGWIWSPIETGLPQYMANEGKANFGFNAKYKNGKNNSHEVDGNTNFQFKEGDFHFKSSSHDDVSLVISGRKATFTGKGTVNGSGSYQFRLIAIDGDFQNGSDPDEFRIKIWHEGQPNNVVYDNKFGKSESSDEATELGGGSIVIHKPKGKKTSESSEKTGTQSTQPAAPDNLNSLEVAPNPMVSYTEIRFSLKAKLRADLLIFDMNGKQLRTLFSAVVNANEMKEVRFDRQNLMSGVYICKLVTGDGRSYEKQIIIE